MTDLIRRIQSAAQVPVTIQVSAVTYIRALVWGASRDGRSAEEMIAAIAADRTGNIENLGEAFSSANTQAAIVGCPTAEYIRELIRDSNISIPGVDLADLTDEVLLGMFGIKLNTDDLDTGVFENGI